MNISLRQQISPPVTDTHVHKQGSTEQHQLNLISQLCGSISGEVWQGVENLPLFSTMELPRNHKRKVKERLKHYVRDPHACDLIDKMLTLDPSKRMGELTKD